MKFLFSTVLLFTHFSNAAETINTAKELESISPDLQQLLENAQPSTENSEELVPVSAEGKSIDLNAKTKLSLKRGDVIKSVNGEPVDSPAKAMELYNELEKSDQTNEQ